MSVLTESGSLPPVPAPGTGPVIPNPRCVDQTVEWLRAQHAAGRVRTAGPVPPLGSPAWCALPDGDTAKWCAVLAAALAWFRESLELPQRLRSELDQVRQACEQAVHEAFTDFGAAVLDLRSSLLTRPDYAELVARRNTYTTPALTPEQIRAKARASWAEFEAAGPSGVAA